MNHDEGCSQLLLNSSVTKIEGLLKTPTLKALKASHSLLRKGYERESLPFTSLCNSPHQSLCAMLPYCDRVVSVPRSRYLPSSNRGIPIPKEPTTIGGHLRKCRLQLKLFQSEAARGLNVSTRTLSLWECDRLYPTWSYWPRIIDYLGHDPFDNPALGRPKGNESRDVASLLKSPPRSFGGRLLRRRLKMKKTRKQCAQELGISVKTLWNWEMNRRRPSELFQKRLSAFFRYELFPSPSRRTSQ